MALGEGVADEAEPALGMETLPVEGDDAGGFLAAMLERVQAERGDGGGVGMAEDAEHPAFLAQACRRHRVAWCEMSLTMSGSP